MKTAQFIEVTAKDGWKNASVDEMQKSSANMLAKKHCLNANAIYEAFNKMNIYLPSIMHHFMGADWLKNNSILFEVLLNDETIELFELIKNDYKPLN